MWDNTNEEVAYYNKVCTDEIKKAFSPTIPVYAATGNHDTWPVNVEDFSAPYINYPINHLVDEWTDWFGEEAAAEFAMYGYCSIPFRLADG